MSTSRITILQRAVHAIISNNDFRERGARASSLSQAINTHYKLEELNVNTAAVSHVVGKLDHNIDVGTNMPIIKATHPMNRLELSAVSFCNYHSCLETLSR